MKLRARFTPRLNTWAMWMPPHGWITGLVGFGYSLDEAYMDWSAQYLRRATV